MSYSPSPPLVEKRPPPGGWDAMSASMKATVFCFFSFPAAEGPAGGVSSNVTSAGQARRAASSIPLLMSTPTTLAAPQERNA